MHFKEHLHVDQDRLCIIVLSQGVRLRAGAVDWAGRVEVYMNGEWGTVCDNSFYLEEGNVVCRSLGYGTAKFVLSHAGYGRGVGRVHLTDVE